MRIFLILLLAASALAQDIPALRPEELAMNPATPPTAEFYRRLLLNMRREGNFQLHLPGQKVASVSYRLQWNVSRLTHSAPKFYGSPDAQVRNWSDHVWTAEGSTLTVENAERPLPIDCVFVQGQDNLGAYRRPAVIPRFVLKLFFVANDPECRGPINNDPTLYSVTPFLWDTFLQYEVRDTTVFLPLEPKLRYFRNEAALIWDNG